MQASCMQAGTLGTVPSVGSQHGPQSQGQPRPEFQLWEGGQGTPKTIVTHRAVLCSHALTPTHRSYVCPCVCAHCGAVHTEEALTCALTCPAMHKSSLPCAHTPHTNRNTPWYMHTYALPVHTQSTPPASHTSPAHSTAAELVLGGGCTGVLITKLIFTEEAVETLGPWSPHPRLSILLQRHTRVTHGVSLVPPLHREDAGWMEGEGDTMPCHQPIPSSTGAYSARVPRKRHAEAHREREVQSREELNTRMVIYSS